MPEAATAPPADPPKTLHNAFGLGWTDGHKDLPYVKFIVGIQVAHGKSPLLVGQLEA